MGIESREAWRTYIEQSDYDVALPWERLFINYYRWRDGEPPLRATPRAHRRRPSA